MWNVRCVSRKLNLILGHHIIWHGLSSTIPNGNLKIVKDNNLRKKKTAKTVGARFSGDDQKL